MSVLTLNEDNIFTKLILFSHQQSSAKMNSQSVDPITGITEVEKVVNTKHLTKQNYIIWSDQMSMQTRNSTKGSCHLKQARLNVDQ